MFGDVAAAASEAFDGNPMNLNENELNWLTAATMLSCVDTAEEEYAAKLEIKKLEYSLVGAGIGGYIAANFLSPEDYTVAISENSIADLAALGFATPEGFVPANQFGTESLSEAKNLIILALGGLMVGFGARYAGGCTSGHAISGISNLQPASLLAVVGFFIGGLLMTHVLFPLIY